MSANDLFSGMSRRQFLATTAAAAVATSLPLRARYGSPTAQYTRISLTDPGASAMLDSYATAIKALLTLPPTDPRNFYRNAFIHTLDCPHGNWWFLPWHRGYLGWWEQTVRSLSGNPKFAFPYWDWTVQPYVPDAFWQGGDASPRRQLTAVKRASPDPRHPTDARRHAEIAAEEQRDEDRGRFVLRCNGSRRDAPCDDRDLLRAPGGTLTSAARAPETHKTVTATLPRAAASNEALAVRISAGVLPRGARIIVRLQSGEIAGSVTPYGVRTGQKAELYTIPLPQHAVANGRVTVHLELSEKRGEPRAPTEQEVEKVEVVYVPVSG